MGIINSLLKRFIITRRERKSIHQHLPKHRFKVQREGAIEQRTTFRVKQLVPNSTHKIQTTKALPSTKCSVGGKE